MSSIEDAAKPTLTRMIRDEPTVLSTEDQGKIARWLALKAVLHHYGVPTIKVSTLWTDEFLAKREPPRSWQVRIARYAGNRIVLFGSHPFEATYHHDLLSVRVRRPAFLFTAQLGHFIGQVIGSQQEAWALPTPRFIQIWPHPLLRSNNPSARWIASVSWPPERSLADSELKRCSQDPAQPKD
jgi:hypothetical protein